MSRKIDPKNTAKDEDEDKDFALTVPDEIHQRIEQLAVEHHLTTGEIVTRLLQRAVDDYKNGRMRLLIQEDATGQRHVVGVGTNKLRAKRSCGRLRCLQCERKQQEIRIMDIERAGQFALGQLLVEMPKASFRARKCFAAPRPALRYYGSKWRLAPWIISHFPPHVCYVEPFGGGANVLLSKPPSTIEVYNDLDDDVVNFFAVLRERPGELIRAIELTPFARAELVAAYEPCDDDPSTSSPVSAALAQAGQALEQARRFYVRAWQGRSGPTAGKPGGWRFQVTEARGKHNVRGEWNATAHLWQIAARLKQVYVECDNALVVIHRYDTPNTLFYCDPPYVQSARARRWRGCAYRSEMSDDAHRELAAALHHIRGMAVISGYSSPLYDELYDSWRCVQTRSRTEAHTTKVERLWLSPGIDARTPQLRLALENATRRIET